MAGERWNGPRAWSLAAGALLLTGGCAWTHALVAYPNAWIYPRADLEPWLVAGALSLPLLALAGVIAYGRRHGRPFTNVAPGLALWVAWFPVWVQLDARRGHSTVLELVRTLPDAQTTFREGDKEGDGVLDYGTLDELVAAGLLSERVARPRGYDVGVRFGEGEGRDFLWVVVANPQETKPESADWDDAVAYVVNHRGVAHCALAPLDIASIGTDCSLPPGARPRGEAQALLAGAGRPVRNNRWWTRHSPLPFPVAAAVALVVPPLFGAWVLALGPFRRRT